MSKYLFIESRDPFDYADVARAWGLATELAGKGHDVSMFLVQNAVLAARKGAAVKTAATGEGVKLFADDLSLDERAIPTSAVKPGVEVAGIDALTDRLMEDGCKAIWL